MAEITGTPGDDDLVGTDEDDLIRAKAGNDRVFGGLGNDEIRGEADNDIIDGEDDDDLILGGSGNDTLVGGRGDDDISGQNGDDIANGGAGDDKITGNAGVDDLRGSGGDDLLIGGSGGDSLRGGTGNDRLVGNGGADDLIGGDGDDDMSGGGGNDVLDGGSGNDSLNGGNGDDELIVGEGDDIAKGGSDADEFVFVDIGTGVTTITDLNLNQGDTLDFSRIIPLYEESEAPIEDFVRIRVRGEDTTFDVDPTGSGSNFIRVAVAAGTQVDDISAEQLGLPNRDPVAGEIETGTDQNTASTIDLLGASEDPDRDPISIRNVNDSDTVGSVEENDDGTVNYDPGDAFKELPEGGTAEDSFRYTVEDSREGRDGATVTVTVSGLNDAPVAVDDEDTTNEKTAIDINVLDNDEDIDLGDQLTVTEVNTDGTTGTVAINVETGNVNYDPAGQFDALNEGDTGTDTFAYTVQDLLGAAATATVTVEIEGVNDAPVAVDDEATVGEKDDDQVIDVLANDSDVDDTELVVSEIDDSATIGSVEVDDDGNVIYGTNGEFDSLAEGTTGTDGFSYTISDLR